MLNLQLLDDDYEVIGTLHQDCVSLEGELSPASIPGAGHDYLELKNIRVDEVVEILGTHPFSETLPHLLINISASFLLMCSLRERMYWITKYVYGQQSSLNLSAPTRNSSLGKLRKKASRSFANWRQTLFRNKKQ